jgi:hypothetical protein
VYISTPLTSGELVISWHELRMAGEGLQGPSKEKVFSENRARARSLIERARASFQTPVIEPVSFTDVPGWTQPDYHSFWCAVIERHAYAVVFNRDWHLSTGCAAEFAAAVLSGAEIYDDEFEPMQIEVGLDLLRDSHARLANAKLSTSMLDDVFSALQSMA